VEAGASPLPLRLNPGRGSAVKVVLTTAMISFGFAYLALCAYGISRTGSTAGLADIGNAAAVAVVIGSLAALVKK
jgi:uncharacterized membrane protein